MTETTTTADERDWDLIDAVELAMEAAPERPDWSPSDMAKALRRGDDVKVYEIRSAFEYLAANTRNVVRTGKGGCWTRYALDDHRRDVARRFARSAAQRPYGAV